MSRIYGELTEEEKMAHEEARLLGHQAKFDWNKTKTVSSGFSPRRETAPTPGKRVVIYWLDREQGFRVVEPMSVNLDQHGRLPMGFIQAEWNCSNLQLKDGPVLKPADGGYSLQAMPNAVHLEFYATDNARGKGRKNEPHVEIEVSQDLTPGRLPGMGLTHSTYETTIAAPAPRAAAPTQAKFCSNCGSKLAGGKFCPGCGSPI